MTNTPRTSRFDVRLPSPLHRQLVELARANDRSLNSIIVQLLGEAVEGPQAHELAQEHVRRQVELIVRRAEPR